MKSNIFLIISLVLLITSIKTNGQVLVIKKDSISFGNDTVAVLTLPNYRGDIYWQQSLDNKNWITSTINGKDSLIIPLRFNANYRAKIIDGNCSPVFSDTAKIIVTDSIKTVFANGLLEIAYPDSTDEIVKFAFNTDTFACNKVKGEYIFQGDIVLTTKQIQLFSELKGGGISPTVFNAELWPENKVYYTIDASLKDDERIISAIKHWEANTSIRFDKRVNQENYIEFIWDKNSCSSNLGMVGVKQLLKLADWGTSGNVIHEIGHAIGLIHEHSREDRESFITVVESNITTDWKDQFTIVPYATISTNTFDFNSIMIYSGLINNSEVAIDPTKPVMIKKSDGLPWDAQRNNLSMYDIEIVKKMYPPIKPTVLTIELTNITQSAANGGGNVTNDGGAAITSRGVVWSTAQNPTRENNLGITINGTGKGSFTSYLTDLTANTPYNVRAYATNSQGTAYGNQITFTTSPESNLTGTFTDSRDGHIYKTIKIGEQVWMAENLGYLPAVSPPKTDSNAEPCYYVYGYEGTSVVAAKNNSNYATYGVLYNWPAAKAACPAGWHLPTDAEWTILENYLIANGYNYDGTTTGNKINKSMAAKTNWSTSSGTGEIGNNLSLNNKSGFSALPGGGRGNDGHDDVYFNGIADTGLWWSSTESDTEYAWGRVLFYNYDYVDRDNSPKEFGFSVRCVRD